MKYHKIILANGVYIAYKYIAKGTRVVAIASAWHPTDAELSALPRKAWRPWNTSTNEFTI